MFWDKVAGVYDLFVNIVNRKTHKKLKQLIAKMIYPKDEVLECACGTGLLTAVIAGRCQKLTATDFSAKMLEKARKNCKAFNNVEFAKADITKLPYEDDSFDVVVAGNVIHLLDDPYSALNELKRVCKKDGRLIIATYMNKDKNGKSSLFSETLGKAGADFKRQFTIGSYRSFFEEAGFHDIEISLAEGLIPCAIALMKNEEEG